MKLLLPLFLFLFSLPGYSQQVFDKETIVTEEGMFLDEWVLGKLTYLDGSVYESLEMRYDYDFVNELLFSRKNGVSFAVDKKTIKNFELKDGKKLYLFEHAGSVDLPQDEFMLVIHQSDQYSLLKSLRNKVYHLELKGRAIASTQKLDLSMFNACILKKDLPKLKSFCETNRIGYKLPMSEVDSKNAPTLEKITGSLNESQANKVLGFLETLVK